MTESFGPRPARPVRPLARIAALLAACFVAFSLLLLAVPDALLLSPTTSAATLPVEHVYALAGADESAVVANLRTFLKDAIAHQYSRFDVQSASAAAHAYLDKYLTGVSKLSTIYNLYRVLLNTGSDSASSRGFDYERGILNGLTVGIGGAIGPNYAKTVALTIDWDETPAQRQQVMAHVRAFLSSAAYPADGTDEERLSAINEYICRTFAYDASLSNPSPYAMIAPGSASYGMGTCQAYTLYGYLLLTEAGYPTRAILIRHGPDGAAFKPDAAPFDGAGYGWLLVKAGGAWYHMDFTFNDSTTDHRRFFMKSDAQVKADHRWTPMPTDQRTGYGYYPAATTVWGDVPADPTPTPKPTAKPTPKPTAKPTPKPTVKPTATTAPVPTATLAPTAADPTATASPAADPTGTQGATATPSASPSPFPTLEPLADPTVPLTAAPGGTRLPPSLGGFLQQALDAFLAGWRTDPAVAVATTFSAAALLLLGLHLANPRGTARKPSGTLDAENGEP